MVCAKWSLTAKLETVIVLKSAILNFVFQTQWEWLKNQVTARAELIAELLDKMNQFDKKYSALRKFVQESTELLEREKPVGQSAARIEEQMKTCQVC